jgi:hypothetical protein
MKLLAKYFFWILLVVGVMPVMAQGKIKLRRPGAAGTDAPAAPGGKITLTRPGAGTATPASQPDEEYTTSKGPESKSRTLYLGLFGGFNVAGPAKAYSGSNAEAVQKGNSWEFSPMVGLRSELYIKRVYGIVLDLAYQQNRSYILDQYTSALGYLRTDYATARLMFSYRYSLYKVIGKVKFLRPVAEVLKPFAGNLQIGGFVKTPLSAQLEIQDSSIGDPNDPFYDVKPFANTVSAGVMGGLGFEVRLGSAIFFFEGHYFRGLTDSYKDMRSRFFYADKFAEQGIYFSSGIKTGIYGF